MKSSCSCTALHPRTALFPPPKALCPAGMGGLPFSIYKFGNAELSPAGSVGALYRGMAGDVIAHVLHQLLQLGAYRRKRVVGPGCHVSLEPHLETK